MRLRYKFGLATLVGIEAYCVTYAAIQGVDPLGLVIASSVVVGSGIPAMFATSWLFDRLASPRIQATLAPLRLVFFGIDESAVRALRQALEGHPQLTASVAKPGKLSRRQRRLDALYVTLTDAVERWGARPASHKSQMLRTRPEDSDMPPYVVTGVAIGADDPRGGDPGHELKLTLAAVLDAVKSFNAENSPPIRVVGFWTDSLGIDRMNATEAANTIISVYDERLGEN